MLYRVKFHLLVIGDIFVCREPQGKAQRRYILLISLEHSDIAHNPKKSWGIVLVIVSQLLETLAFFIINVTMI